VRVIRQLRQAEAEAASARELLKETADAEEGDYLRAEAEVADRRRHQLDEQLRDRLEHILTPLPSPRAVRAPR